MQRCSEPAPTHSESAAARHRTEATLAAPPTRFAAEIHASPRLLAQRRAISAAFGESDATPVVQCWGWPSWPAWLSWGRKVEDPQDHATDKHPTLVSIEAHLGRQQDARRENARRGNSSVRFDGDEVEALAYSNRQGNEAGKTRLADAGNVVGKTGTVAGAVGSQIAILGNVLDEDALGFAGNVTKEAGAGIGVMGSVLDAVAGLHDMATLHDKKKDKAIKGLGVAGAFANAARVGATGAKSLPTLLADTSYVAGLAGRTVGPAAIATGSADLFTGLAAGGVAHHRSRKLQESAASGSLPGISKYASDAQWLKAKNNYAKATGGAIGMAGGAALLAAGASNPVGWALLAGAGAVGAGAGIYNLYDKHQMGKEMKDHEYNGLLAHDGIDARDDVSREGLMDYLKSESMRRNEAVRKQIAVKLANLEQDSDDENKHAAAVEIVDRLGLKRKESPTEVSALANPDSDPESIRAKTIAKALNG